MRRLSRVDAGRAGVSSLQDASFSLVANGADDSPPAAAVRDFLVARGARRVTTVFHPLEPEHGSRHLIRVYEAGRLASERIVRLPSRPPWTYPVDVLVPLRPSPVDCWIGFNNLAAARGLLQRRLGRAAHVLYWAVDFIPDRFGDGMLTRLYDGLDAYCCRRVDLRVELSEAAREARSERHGLEERAAPAAVAPVGAWIDRVPVTPEDGWRARRVLFLGHLVPRQGVGLLVDAFAILRARGVEFIGEIAGRGPLERELRATVERLNLSGHVHFRGFLSDHRDVEEFLARGSLGVAPYDTHVASFTRFADPSKLRSYVAAGLPIVLTDVPPNAHELAAEAGAAIVDFDARMLADAIEQALNSPQTWSERRAAALVYARRFDWEAILARTFAAAGFSH